MSDERDKDAIEEHEDLDAETIFEDAKELFPNGWDAKKPYLRLTKQPG